jgi:hypothetical protein
MNSFLCGLLENSLSFAVEKVSIKKHPTCRKYSISLCALYKTSASFAVKKSSVEKHPIKLKGHNFFHIFWLQQTGLQLKKTLLKKIEARKPLFIF